MINLPESIKFQGRTIKIKELEDFEMGSSMGRYDSLPDEIKIKKTQSLDQKWRTFIEEVIHMVLFEIGQIKLTQDDTFVQSFTSVLYATLINNDLIKIEQKNDPHPIDSPPLNPLNV